MSHASRIDVFQTDRGLRSCFSASNVKDSWRDEFIAKHSIETLDDYIYMVDGTKWEQSVTDLCNAVASLRDNRVAQARFKAAYEAGQFAIKQVTQVSAKQTDLDEPLPEATFSQMSRDFKARYDVEWDPALDPSDTLRARVFREFKRQTITVIDMKKVKSIVTSSHPKAQESVTLGNGLKLEFDRDVVNDVSGMVQYYMAMRVLMHAWAWAGSYQTKDYDGVDRTMATLSQCLGYADEALRLCAEYGSSSVSWLHRNDTMTRGKVSSLVRRGYTAGSALMEAMRQSHIEWRSPVAPPRPTPEERKRPQPSPEVVAPPPKRERMVKSDAFQTISMVKGGKKICKPFNDGRGCPGNCNQIHGCDVKLPSGKPCLSQKHTRMEHPRE